MSHVYVQFQDDISHVFDLELLVKCASLASDTSTRNHVLSLFSTVAKIIPDKLLDHILDILNVTGEYAVSQVRHSSYNCTLLTPCGFKTYNLTPMVCN
mgnify:FL=1